MARFVFVTGGVISTVGKGILSASICQLIESQGYSVSAVKIDPYINIDAGTMRPTEHGEVFVTSDGFETDQDLGNYERFSSMVTTRENSITTGQIYLSVIENERKGGYGGKCVEVIPHIPLEVMRRLRELAESQKVDVVVVEIGGTVGEYQIFPFTEAARRMKFEGDTVVFVHIGYLPIPSSVGEQKSKPLQRSIFDLMAMGIKPDFVFGRSRLPLDRQRREKIAFNCGIMPEKVISAHDVEFIYEIPVNFADQDFDKRIIKELGLRFEAKGLFSEWKKMCAKARACAKPVKIGIVGKYFDTGSFKLEDSYMSVIEAVKHASWHNDRRPEINAIDSKEFEKNPESLQTLNEFDAVIVPGGFGKEGIEGKISAINYCRKKKIPFLGLCLGLQLAVVEFARNECNFGNANSTEFDPLTQHNVIDILPEQKMRLGENKFGASMRLGNYTAKLRHGSLVHRLYGTDTAIERHRHRYEVNNAFRPFLEQAGMVVSGINAERNLVEYIELNQGAHPFFIATQAHPEFTSRFMKPNPLFDGLVKSAIKNEAKKAFSEIEGTGGIGETARSEI